METSYLKTLELDKIIARASEGCVCKEAREQLLALEPQCDPDEVRYALEQTDAINSLLIKNGSPRFGGVEGVSSLVARAVKGGVLSMGELLMVAGALRNFQNLTSWYGSSEHDALPTDDLFYALAPQPGLEQQISSAILAPDAMADTASHTLNELRKKIRATENSIRDRLESMVRNMDTSKYLQESVVSIRNGRYVVPVKSEYRGEVSGIIHDVSSTGATVFVEPQAVVEANARILQYRAQEAQEIERILVAFTAQVAAIEPQFQYSYKAMLEIDVLLAKARLALDMKAFKPSVRTDSSFSLIRARHPLIDPKKCVPVDIALGKEYDSLIITGPNMAGKSALLRQTALIVIMAQAGCFVPAASAKIGYVDKIFTRVGASDNISQGESTFMVEMNEAANILNNISDRSLVLFDELGRGTSTYDGISIAWAIVEYLHEHPKYHAKTLFATHYHELNEMEHSFKKIKNYNVSVKEVAHKVIFLRKLVKGGSNHSFGIQVGKMAGLPQSVIKRADEILKQLENDRDKNGTIQKNVESIASAREGLQLSFFQLDDPVLSQIRDEIAGLDINGLTPLEALNKLSEIKKIILG